MGIVEPSVTSKNSRVGIPMVRHLHLLEDLDGDDVEARPSIDESTIDGDIIDGRRA
jgi:hypothetical protein